MPNSRRRKFSVRNGPYRPKTRNDSQTSVPDIQTEMKHFATNIIAMKSSSKNMRASNSLDSKPEIKSSNNNSVDLKQSQSRNKIPVNISKNTNHSLMSECESSTSMAIVKKRSNDTVDKDVTASSSNINIFNIKFTSKDFAEPWKKEQEKTEMQLKKTTHSAARDKTPHKREKYRQHRMKVRSPKRRSGIRIVDNQNKNDNDKRSFSIGTEVIDWGREGVEREYNGAAEAIEDEGRHSDNSSDDMCRICHGGDSLSQELGQLISACSCRGTVGRVHVKCLERWLTESGKSRCELCGTRYTTRRVHRYGVPRALLMWVLSQNAKQLMVDSLGIMMMSPLAVLAAWLSGRTLAGLMTQESHVTPWPLASTFVLACMTLVCYYCWIVSAATRHALSWWIWYRSQYEVRLQFVDAED